MLFKLYRYACGAAIGAACLAAAETAHSQANSADETPSANRLPVTVVTTPSPIRQPRRRAVSSAAPAAVPEQVAPASNAALEPGALPVVTDQFATVTVVPNDELRRNPASTLGDQ